MSLINEALKKVQNQQGGPGATPPPGPPVNPNVGHMPKPDKTKQRSFVWGFVAAVLVIGLISILLATFFVSQILGPEEATKGAEPAVVQDSPADITESVPTRTPAPEPVAAAVATAEPVEEAPPAAATTPQVIEPKPDPVVEPKAPISQAPAPSPVPVAESTRPVEPPAVEQAAPVTPSVATVSESPKPPDADVIARLQELQIRGIMSGGVKVLIHDESTGRTRAYRAGEALEGTMGLSVVRISSSTIQFKDYAGSIHTKSF